MDKPIIFISHITEEKELALEIKELLEESFFGNDGYICFIR